MQFDGIRATSFPFSGEHDDYLRTGGQQAWQLSCGQ